MAIASEFNRGVPEQINRGIPDPIDRGGGGILAVLQNGVRAINDLKSALNNIFPQSTATSTTAPSAGTVTFTSSMASIFILVETSTGGTYKIAAYPST